MAKAVVELIAAWADFEEKNNNAGIEDFCRYYLAGKEIVRAVPEDNPKRPLDAQLNRLVNRMSRWNAYYFRRLLIKKGFSCPEEFVMLGTIDEYGAVGKNDLIEMNVFDLAEGTSVLKRMKEKGWIEEITDPDDKRTTKLKLTTHGQQFFHMSVPVMLDIAMQLFRNLEEHEKIVLKNLLIKADTLQRYG